MINNFTYFLYNNDLTDYLNCYSSFIMTRKDLKNNILNHRMNLLINCYTNEEKQKKYKLIEYYIRSYKDNYLLPSPKVEIKEIEFKNKMDENPEKRDDDIEDHYKYMFINPKPKPQIDYDELDRIYELKLQKEEEEKQREKEILLENDYYNDDYNDDYEYCNSDDENENDNEYEFMDEYY